MEFSGKIGAALTKDSDYSLPRDLLSS